MFRFYKFTIIKLLLLALFATMLHSCSNNRNNEHKWLTEISNEQFKVASLDSLYTAFHQNVGTGLSQRLIDMSTDSSTHFKAALLYTTATDEQAVTQLIKCHNRDLINQYWNLLVSSGNSKRCKDFQAEFLRQFDNIDIDTKARFLTQVATPQEIAAHIEEQDLELCIAIRKIYGAYPQKLQNFNNNLKFFKEK